MTYVLSKTTKASIVCLFTRYHNTCIERLNKVKPLLKAMINIRAENSKGRVSKQ